MEILNVESVFVSAGMPTYTYVEPTEYNELLVATRTPGKCIVIEGPSGIGKTTAVLKILDQLRLRDSTIVYSARKPSHIQAIDNIVHGDFSGIAIIDDFHRLKPEYQEHIADMMKVLADEGDLDRKIIIIGINKVSVKPASTKKSPEDWLNFFTSSRGAFILRINSLPVYSPAAVAWPSDPQSGQVSAPS